ncbi:MAG: GNAT family N-acetyltransferase [Pseudomonadota bacterium]|nr:GNAT family N-acetyltransferase [Pseudomonadota bacterium]
MKHGHKNASAPSGTETAHEQVHIEESSSTTKADLYFQCVAVDKVDSIEWETLANDSNSPSNFYHRQFVLSAIKTWRELERLELIVAYEGSRLVFLQPVHLINSVLGLTLEFLEIPTADRIEPLVASSDKAKILAAYRTFLTDSLAPDFISGRSLTMEFADLLAHWFQDASLKSQAVGTGWILSLPQSMENFFDNYSSNFRYQMRHRLRKAEAAGIEFRITRASESEQGELLDAALNKLRDLHGLRFASLGRSSFFLQPDYRAFHDDLVRNSRKAGLRISFTEALHHGRVVGSLYGTRFNDSFTFLMIGFDPDFSNFSPGHLLIYHTIVDLVSRSVDTFDFKCGEESYKQRWSDQQYDKVNLTIALSWSGRMLRWLRKSPYSRIDLNKSKFVG